MNQDRSFGVSFFAVVFILASLASIIFGGGIITATFYITNPARFVQAVRYLKEDPIQQTLYFYYQSASAFAYLFIGFGLWNLRPWARRLLVFLLSLGTCEGLGWSIWFGIHRQFYASGQAAGHLVILVLIILFFRRKAIREQFESEVTRRVVFHQPTSPSSPASPNSGGIHPWIAEKLAKGSGKRDGAASKFLGFFSGIEGILKWFLFLSVMVYAIKVYHPGPGRSFAFAVVWSFAFFIINIYWNHANKLGAMIGGILSVGACLLAEYFIPTSGYDYWIRVGIYAGEFFLANAIGGFVAGKISKFDEWFQGSSAGFAWAVACALGALRFYQPLVDELLYQIKAPGLSPPLLAVLSFLGAFLIGFVGGSMGGVISGLLTFKKRKG